MPYKILKHQTKAVTLGVIDHDFRVEPDLQSVTFADHNGTPHTVYSHKDGPFSSPEAILSAHFNGHLHPYADHDTAIAVSEQRGDDTTADRLRALVSPDKPADDDDKVRY